MVSQPEPGLERILTAAIDLVGRRGLKATSVRSIAEQASVSPALVMHHYGSKEGLRAACDARVLETIVTMKHKVMQTGFAMRPERLEDDFEASRPTLRYLARRLSEGGPQIDEFIDGLVEDAIAYTAEAEQQGLVRPSDDPRARVVVLTLWSLGALILHEHMHRLIGADLLSDRGDSSRYTGAALEVFSRGLLTPDALSAMAAGAPPPREDEETA